ncbi:MAG: helix-turn-helix domain-containing protein [Luteolibacter sp.]|uniref:helix-turn-helix domain-containing protein n=1 Tax=Luteolibacter sp. TaxID=1962973 RepID=UPI003263F5F6
MIAEGSVDEISDQMGERLREARENAGLAVDDVVSQTRIPRTVVEALEDGDFSVFSSPTYARSFLSQYSGFLKVDAGEWLDALEPVLFQPGDTVQSSWQGGRSQSQVRKPTHESSRGWMAAVSALALSGILIYAAIKGYELLEKRFGGDSGPMARRESTDVSAKSQPLEKAPVEDHVPKPVAPPVLDEEIPPSPPPRATIVRDPP